MNTTCICLICLKPDTRWIEFLSTFKDYDVYILVDDNSRDYKVLDKPTMKFIQINEKDCSKNGFTHFNYIIFKKITGWDKAVYYFSVLNTKYEAVWFLEDDVFLYNEQTLLNVDVKYPRSDLLTARYIENTTGHKNDWHWSKITIHTPPPYYSAMVCACRLSRGLLEKIKEYATKYKMCFFIEALFPTLCKQNNLIYDTPSELVNIHYRKNYTVKDINTIGLYHPVKLMDEQMIFRNYLTSLDSTVTLCTERL